MKHSDEFPRLPTSFWRQAAVATEIITPKVRGGADPCNDCVAVCCWFLPLEQFDLRNSEDLGFLKECLQYEHFAAWVAQPGQAALGLVSRCRFLDVHSCSCQRFGQPERPDICVRYDAKECWYRPFVDGTEKSAQRLRAAHWPAFSESVTLSPAGLVIGLPKVQVAAEASGPFGPKVVLEFDMPPSLMPTPKAFEDFLYFLSNFERCTVVRAPDSWGVLVDTRRRVGADVGEVEVLGDQPFGVPRAESVTLSAEQLNYLRREQTGFGALSVTALQALITKLRGQPG